MDQSENTRAVEYAWTATTPSGRTTEGSCYCCDATYLLRMLKDMDYTPISISVDGARNIELEPCP